jgi:hypothetical protein
VVKKFDGMEHERSTLTNEGKSNFLIQVKQWLQNAINESKNADVHEQNGLFAVALSEYREAVSTLHAYDQFLDFGETTTRPVWRNSRSVSATCFPRSLILTLLRIHDGRMPACAHVRTGAPSSA